MNHILVVSVNWLGDVIFSTPVYKALRAAHPGARITALAVPRVEDVLRLCPAVDEVIVLDEEGEHRPLIGRLCLIRQLRAGQFDAVFFLRPSLSRSFLCFLAGIPCRVGFSHKTIPGLLTHPVPVNDRYGRHRSEAYAALLEGFGIPVTDRTCELLPDAALATAAVSFLEGLGVASRDQFAIVNTGGNWDLQPWPETRCAELARRLRADKGWKILLPGSLKDMERTTRIAAAAGEGVHSIAGGTGIRLLAGIFSHARCLISADSGPLHLASALGVPTVGLFGPTRPEITGPRGRGRSAVMIHDVGCNKAPCYYLECPDNRCMKSIEVNDVLKVLQDF